MTLKIQAASAEEYAFAAEVNKQLKNGARVNAFTMADPADPDARPTHHLTFQLGTRRTTITADAPFYLDPVEDVVKRVNEWIAGVGRDRRWSTEMPADLD